ncbi:MAG: DUF5597 domain-containing protein [Bacteroidetes bacterium]|nr:DUF5597 domain-containing protein [Bacteroidota bacterium]
MQRVMLHFLVLYLVTVSILLAQQEVPFLRKQGSATQLVVHGKPVLMLAGELGNSSASDPIFLQSLFPRLKQMNLNTVLVPVYWELVEPQEGKFDFSLVDSAITYARRSEMKLVLLWFGSWKNSMSCYAPYWVKVQYKRFPRARTKEGRALEILTPFSDENRKADGKAFGALMRHIREVDSRENTVLMVQVENEIGMIPDARDYCIEAEQAFRSNVPQELMEYLHKNTVSLSKEVLDAWSAAGMKRSGTWEEVFGKGLHTDEFFMAWYFARYTNYVAEQGKKEYNIPMYVNAALIRPNYKPGQYPSAGPLPHLMDIWKVAAPSIDFLAPDIYFKNFAEWLGRYDQKGNPVFIPEVDHRQSVVNAFYAVAQHNAMGYSPFAIEFVENPENNQFAKGYALLRQLTPLILEHQGKGSMRGFLLDSATHDAKFTIGKFTFHIKHEYSWPYGVRKEGEVPRYGGCIVQVADDEFYIAGTGIVVTFHPSIDDGTIVGIASIDEGHFENGKWVPGRRLNGDESHQGRHLNISGNSFGIQKVKLYTYR